jgi:hypothetical protein
MLVPVTFEATFSDFPGDRSCRAACRQLEKRVLPAVFNRETDILRLSVLKYLSRLIFYINFDYLFYLKLKL